MKFSFKAFMGAFVVLALFSSCTKDDNKSEESTTPETNLILINSVETDQGIMEVSVYAKDSLTVSYNSIFIKVKNLATGNIITDANVTIIPMMDMGTMMHSAPVENPVSAMAADDMYEAAVVFIMPAEMGWTLNISVYDPIADVQDMAIIPVKVLSPPQTLTKVVTTLDGNESLVISYLQPMSPKIGVNDMELTIHKRESMMSFPAVNNYTVEIDPEMVAMGHGSPNNVNPVSSGMGHYKGKVNFTMSGNWRINLKLMDGEAVVDSTTYFDITF